ncbi:MAG: hypothetical protein M3R26_00475 [Actinomycetota bacterium]|nr:hypothetical protein [Actinomycetota bacterium]MDQ2984425.1 hypothetical protein [Actinomycetota bacterium]
MISRKQGYRGRGINKRRLQWSAGWATLFGVVLLLAGGTTVATGANTAKQGKQHLLSSKPVASDGTMNAPAARAMRQGYLVPNQAAYELAKRQASGAAGATSRGANSGVDLLEPVTALGWSGIFDASRAPSDSTSSVGLSRYIELVNSKYAIYNRGFTASIGEGTLNALAGSVDGDAFDPQIMWDSQTNRFYYAMNLVVSASDNKLAIGFSKTASPASSADFCHYFVNFGADFPDYPRLGDSAFFWMIGSNVFSSSSTFIGADVYALTKPPGGPTCPAQSTFKTGENLDLRDSFGSKAWTPVPVNQIDPDGTGWIVARRGVLPSSSLSLHRVARKVDGTPSIQSTGTFVQAWASYNIPPDAPQRVNYPNSDKLLDTLDARLTQAVSALDPGHPTAGGTPQLGIWTQHAVLHQPTGDPPGHSEVRWYEINPVGGPYKVVQSGKCCYGGGYDSFNGAISPDRSTIGPFASRHGDNMVLGFSTSGKSSFPSIRMISKRGTQEQSSTLVKSSGNYVGPDCAGADNICSWGDYSGASPDPNPYPAGSPTGRVWLVNQYSSGGTSSAIANWRTWNWIATP